MTTVKRLQEAGLHGRIAVKKLVMKAINKKKNCSGPSHTKIGLFKGETLSCGATNPNFKFFATKSSSMGEDQSWFGDALEVNY